MALENNQERGSIIERIVLLLQPIIDLVIGRTHKSIGTTLLAQQEKIYKKAMS